MHFEEVGFLGSGTVWLGQVFLRFEGKTFLLTVRNINPRKQHDIPEDPDPQEHRSGNFQSHKSMYFTYTSKHIYWIWHESAFSSEY